MKLRIAPSPTGFLHIGNARTALFNWLYARANNGTFLVRIDDTDTLRSSDEYIKDIIQNFKWLGIDWDEGIEVGGPHGEYKQSLRFDRYREIAESLVAKDLAYEAVISVEKCISDYEQRNALYNELNGRLLKAVEDYSDVKVRMESVEGVNLETVS